MREYLFIDPDINTWDGLANMSSRPFFEMWYTDMVSFMGLIMIRQE